MNTKQLTFIVCCLAISPTYNSSIIASPNKFVTEYDSYLAGSYVFPTTLSIGLLSGLFLMHVGAQSRPWYKQLEYRALREKREGEEKKLRAKLRAEFEKEEARRKAIADKLEAERLKKDAALAAQLEEENKRRQEKENAAQAKRADIVAKLEKEAAVDGECPICCNEKQLWGACENFEKGCRCCSSCLQGAYARNPNRCSICTNPYIISQQLRNLWANNAAPANDNAD